jgi:hypothetical protein
MPVYCLKNGLEIWYKPRTKWVRLGKDVTWDAALDVQDTMRKLGFPCYIVLTSKG